MKLHFESFSKIKSHAHFNKPTAVFITKAQLEKDSALKFLHISLQKKTKTYLDRHKDRLEHGKIFHLPSYHESENDFYLAIHPEKTDMHSLLEFTRTAVSLAVHNTTRELQIIFGSTDQLGTLTEALGAALTIRTHPLPLFGKKSEKQKPFHLESVTLVGPDRKILPLFEEGLLSGHATHLVRYLGYLPPNFLDPAQYGKKIRELSKENGFEVKFISKKELKKMGAGAFTAVDQGNPESEGGIYEITFEPSRPKNKNPICLVGKGLCFDTGGYDIKTNSNMVTMKGDMQGSAVALSLMILAKKLNLPLYLKAFLAVTENHISPLAYHPDEVVTALNGIAIEVMDTDAEGRMVLADTLVLAARTNPALIMDFATLTGAAVRAVGSRYGVVFTNQEDLHTPLKNAGLKSGERVWLFPLDPQYDRALESKIADTLQCAKGPGPDHIYAAIFLSKFVDDKPWIHVDLAASECDGGLAHVESSFTGFGVRFAMEFLRTKFLKK